MRLARIRTDGGVVSGRYDDGVVTADGEEYEVGVDAELLAPCDPTALYCVGRNYAATVDQMDYDIPDQPTGSSSRRCRCSTPARTSSTPTGPTS